jgi:predicted NBD/HSP70 family sugar kinase
MYATVDVGGTNTRVAVSNDGKTIANKKRFPTPDSFEDGVSKIANSIDELTKEKVLKGAAIGVAGVVNRAAGKTLVTPNLKSWDDRNIVETFQSRLNVPISFANDAELAALGEAVFGSGKDHRIVGFLTVSTGIGGALVVDKKLVARAYNSEPGHMMVELNGKLHPGSGQKGDWELYASGKAFEARFGMKPEDCLDPGIWEVHARALGQGVMNVILLWSPEILVIGGGLSRKGKLFFNPLLKFINENLKMFPPPPIVPACLEDDAGLYGGLVLLKTKGLKD